MRDDSLTKNDLVRIKKLAAVHGWELPEDKDVENWLTDTAKSAVARMSPREIIPILNWIVDPVAHCSCNCR